MDVWKPGRKLVNTRSLIGFKIAVGIVRMQEPRRLRIFHDKAELTIEIGPARDWRSLTREIAGPLILSALCLQSIQLLVPFSETSNAGLAYLYIALFSLLAGLSLLRFAWATFGQEQIVLRGGLLTVSWRLGILCTSRTYRLNVLRDIHTAFRLTSRFRLARGRVGFSYENRQRYMADRISSEDARMLVKVFREWLPKEVWTPVLGI